MKELSKELSIEEKAKAYDEALSVAQETYTTQPMYREWLAKMFPELKESEDEKIRKELIAYCQVNMGHTWHNIKQEDYITWLEKRGKKGTNGNKREIPNSEQRSVDKDKSNLLTVERAIKVSPFMRTGFENEPAKWSEEDIVAIDCAVEVLSKDLPSLAASIKRLKSLRPHSQWKPSDEQMKALDIAIRCGIQLDSWEEEALKSLKEQLFKLKKLREE